MATRPSPNTQRTARDYASIEEAAERLGCSQRTVRRMIAAGEIAGYRLGKRLLRIDLAELDSIMRRIPTAGGDATQLAVTESQHKIVSYVDKTGETAVRNVLKAQGRRR